MVTLGIIGYGYWGTNLLRNFTRLDSCQVKTVVDVDASRLALAKKAYPYLRTEINADSVISDPEIDAIVIATPVSLHYQLCNEALLQGKHVLVEKPMTNLMKEALHLFDLAQAKNKVLMVDNTFLYTGSVKKIKSLIDSNAIGELQYFDATRINLGLFQTDVNVVWDLVTHDVSILRYLVEEKPKSVIATGIAHTENKLENIAYVTVFFQSNLIAHINCSWISPVKMRTILLGGTKKMIVYDDLEPTEKVKVYDSGYSVTAHTRRVDYRIGDIFVPKIEMTEALVSVAEDFIGAITTGGTPVSDAKLGVEVVSILEAIDYSLKHRGAEVKIP